MTDTKRTIDDLETEAAMLGITSLTFVKKDRVWKATAFGDGHISMGKGETMAEACEDMILTYRVRMQKKQAANA